MGHISMPDFDLKHSWKAHSQHLFQKCFPPNLVLFWHLQIFTHVVESFNKKYVPELCCENLEMPQWAQRFGGTSFRKHFLEQRLWKLFPGTFLAIMAQNTCFPPRICAFVCILPKNYLRHPSAMDRANLTSPISPRNSMGWLSNHYGRHSGYRENDWDWLMFH